MSRLSVRTPSGAWLDVCQSEWYVRDAKNENWIRLVVSKEMKVRHGSNAYWLNIECDVDDIYCPPDEVLECWPGLYGEFDNGIIIDGGPTGSKLCDCDGGNCFTYSGPGPSGEGKGNVGLNSGGHLLATSATTLSTGSKENPLQCPVTAFGGRATITEFYVDVSQISGMVTLNARGVTGNVRVRVYKNCELLADTDHATNQTHNGIKSYLLKFMNDTASGIGRVLVRVDAPSDSTLWEVALSCPNQDPDFNFLEPAPCGGTYTAQVGCNAFAYERVHKIEGSGLQWLEIYAGKDPIRVSVYYQGKLLVSTGDYTNGWISGNLNLSWTFAPKFNDDQLTVRIECKTPVTDWMYAIYCPGAIGSYANPAHCCGGGRVLNCDDFGKLCPPEYNISGNGADVTDTWFDLYGQINGKVYIPYNFIGGEMQLLVYQNGILVSGIGPTTGQGRVSFAYHAGNGTRIRIRVIGSCCPRWDIQMKCPVPVPQACVDSPRMVRPAKGQTGQLCFTVYLDGPYDETVFVDFETRSSNAKGIYAETKVLVEDEFSYPFLAVADSGVGRVIYDGGFPKFYNNVNNWVTDQYLINVVNYCMNPNKARRALVVSTANRGMAYPADGQPHGFGIRVPNILGQMGFITDVVCADDPFFGGSGTMDHDYDKLEPYSMIIFFSSAGNWLPVLTERAAIAYGQYVAAGNGLFIVTDHDVFQSPANMIAKQFGVTFYGVVDRQPVSIAASIAKYGDSPLWHGIRDQIFAAGFSEGIVSVNSVPPDYVPKKGRVEFSPCENEVLVCVDVLGISRPGPDRTVDLVLTGGTNVTLCNPGVGTGTIENNFVANCPSNTQLAVKDGGANAAIGSGARSMYVQDNFAAANNGFSAIMDMKIYFPAEGIYTFYVWGDDEADLYVDCELVVAHVLSSGITVINPVPVSRPYWVPAGEVYLYLVYRNKGPKTRNPSSVAMKILYPNGVPFYVSNAANWRSRILTAGYSPVCSQFAPVCSVGPTLGVINSPSTNDHDIGYPANRIQSVAHAVNCAPGGTYYIMERALNFPVSGVYTWYGTADDNFWIYIDCVLVATGDSWENTFSGSFYLEAGDHNISVMYKNVPNCTPGWAKFAFISPNGVPHYYSEATGWLSVQGQLSSLGFNLKAIPVQNWISQQLVNLGAQLIEPIQKPDYSYWIAELKFNFPKSGTYYLSLYGDDQVTMYVDCTQVAYVDYETNTITYASFNAGQGESTILLRGWNAKAKNPCYAIFIITDESGNTVYASNPNGWKARLGDLDYTGIV